MYHGALDLFNDSLCRGLQRCASPVPPLDPYVCFFQPRYLIFDKFASYQLTIVAFLLLSRIFRLPRSSVSTL